MTVETAHARLTFDPWRGGGITSLIEKQTGREVVGKNDAPLAELVALKEGPGPEPSWEYRTTGDRHYAGTARARVTARRTPLGWRVEVVHAFPDAEEVRRTFELFDDDPRIDCTVEIVGYSGSRLLGQDRHNHIGDPVEVHQRRDPEDRDLFGVLFPVAMSGVAPRWSDRFSSRVIRRSVNYLDFRTHQSNFESGSGLYSSEQWIAATPDVSIVAVGDDDSSAGASRRGIALGMVRVVHPDRPALKAAAERLTETLGVRGITATPYLDTENQGDDPLQTDQIIALGGATISGVRNELIASQTGWGDIADTRYVRDIALWGEDEKQVPALVLQGADDDALIREVDALVAELSDDHINVQASAVESDAVSDLDGFGLGVINNGTIAASCEPDGSLFMALQHAAGWCDWATPFYLGHPFVPERRTGVFRFAILPFAGTWADARVPEVAAAYNRPLVARAGDAHPGELPSTQTLVKIDAEGALVSAVKPAGQSSAQFSGDVMDAAAGLVVRAWNWDRDPGSADISAWTGIASAHLCDPAERPAGELEIRDGATSIGIGANAIETAVVVPNRAGDVAPSGNADVAPRVIPSRWWLHNAGAAPIGNMPVSVALRGDVLPGDSGAATVSVANNMRDGSLRGVVRLTGPEGWSIEPSEVKVDLEPLAGCTVDVQVTVSSGTPGRLRASLDAHGAEYVDWLSCGEVVEPRVRVELVESGIAATVENVTPDRLDCTVTLIAPVEAWSEATEYACVPVDFRERGVAVEAGGEERMDIDVPPDFARHSWAYVKVAFAGVARYHRVPVRLEAAASADAGAPTSLDAPLADASLTVTTDADAEVCTTMECAQAPPNGCDDSPLAGVRTYWTVGGIDDAVDVGSATLRVGVVPAQLGTIADKRSARLARWSGGGWHPTDSTFDERTWTLAVDQSPESLSEATHWTFIGDSDEVWRARVGGRFFEADPYVGDIDGDGRPEIVVGTAANEIVVLDESGAIRWRRRYTGWIWPSTRFSCADVNGDGRQEIVVGTNDRTMALLDCSGRELWRHDDQPFAQKTAPAIGDIDGDGIPEIVTGVYDHGIYAWRADGTPLWQTRLEPMLMSAPAIVDGGGEAAVFVNLGGLRLVRIAGDGSVVFERCFSDGHATGRRAATPLCTTALSDGVAELVFAGHDGVLRVLGLDGEERWSLDVGFRIMGAPAIMPASAGESPMLVCAAGNGRVVSVTPDGEIVHESTLGAAVEGSVVVADVDGDGEPEVLVGTSRTLRTHVLDRQCREIARLPYGAIWSHTPAVMPADADGRMAIVVGNGDECVVAAHPGAFAD